MVDFRLTARPDAKAAKAIIRKAIDRARLGTTRIGHGAKIDNLVQIAHNVVVGPHSVIVAQTGIAGSTRLGERVVFMAQSGAAGHLEVGDGAFVGARGGVIEDLEPGARVFGLEGAG